MGRTGRCIGNMFTEHLWCPLKYEAVYLNELSDGLHFEVNSR